MSIPKEGLGPIVEAWFIPSRGAVSPKDVEAYSSQRVFPLMEDLRAHIRENPSTLANDLKALREEMAQGRFPNPTKGMVISMFTIINVVEPMAQKAGVSAAEGDMLKAFTYRNFSDGMAEHLTSAFDREAGLEYSFVGSTPMRYHVPDVYSQGRQAAGQLQEEFSKLEF